MYKVLLVDDEPLVTEGLELLIDWGAHGFRICGTAANGWEALQQLKETCCHLLITDIRMPVMEGLELIREAKLQRQTPPKCIVLSGYNDFSYAKQAIGCGVEDYLLKPIDKDELIAALAKIRGELDREQQLLSQLQQTRRYARDRMLSDLGSGLLTPRQLDGLCKEYELWFREERYGAALFEIADFHSIVQESVRDARLYLFGLRNILEEVVEHAGRGYVYEDSQGTLGIVLQGPETFFREELGAWLAELYRTASEVLRIGIQAGAGDPVSDPLDIRRSRKQARAALDSIPAGQPGVAAFDGGGRPEWADIEWDVTPLLTAIEEANLQGTEREVARLIAEIRDKRLSRHVTQGLLLGILSSLGRLAQRYKLDYAAAAAELPGRIKAYDSPDELSACLNALCSRIVQALLEAMESRSGTIIHQVKEYIAEHLEEELSLKSISQLFYINSAYLGQLFKKQTQMSFNDYLNRMRIRRIKLMSAREDVKIYEIIMDAGYKNPEYFYRQFKKYEGISFAEFNERRKRLHRSGARKAVEE